MAMTRDDWKRRYYTPLPANVRRVHVDHREDELRDVISNVMDLHSFGQFLYHDVIAMQRCGRAFDGKPEWFHRATAEGWIDRPNKPFPIGQTRMALLVFNAHTMAMFGQWAERTKAPTLGSYLSFLRRHKLPISVKPITDPFTREALLNKRQA
jgi:hypothetical protein